MGIARGPGQLTPYEAPRQALQVFQERLPISDGQLHFLVPGGTGDNLWIVGKLWQVCMERQVTFWLPAGEQKRSGDLFRMFGLPYGYMPDLTTEWIWSRPGSPPIPDTGAILSVQPNRHLEHGHRIEKWYPEYEFRNPVEFIDQSTMLYGPTAGASGYVVGFMSQERYMEHGGNLKPGQWARIWRMVEDTIGPVVLIGAGKDVEFAEEVLKFFNPTHEPMFNAPFDAVMALFAGAKCTIGAHAGPLILSTYMGIPTLQGMPRWLAPMAGTWEPEDAPWGAVYLDELENFIRAGVTYQGNRSLGAISGPTLKVYGDIHPRWRKAEPVSEEPQPTDLSSLTVGISPDILQEEMAKDGYREAKLPWPELAEADV